MRIDVSKMTNYVGKKTLMLIEERLKKMNSNGLTGVEVDVTNLPLRSDFVVDVAKLQDDYDCIFVGLSEKEDKVDSIVSTGYFIKEELGNELYGERFKRLVEMADYPLMVKDNRGIGDELIPLNIIQPISFDTTHFYYNVIKPYLLEPMELEKAVHFEGKKIWDRESIHISDIGELQTGFRFANTKRERTIMDILTNVIEGTLRGFYIEGK